MYSVSPNSTLYYTMQKLLVSTCTTMQLTARSDRVVASSHRVFVTDELPPTSTGNLTGIVSTVDGMFFPSLNTPH